MRKFKHIVSSLYLIGSSLLYYPGQAFDFSEKKKKNVYHFLNMSLPAACDALSNLVQFAPKQPWGSVTFSKVASSCTFTKINTPQWVFFTIFKIAQIVPNHAKHLIRTHSETYLKSCHSFFEGPFCGNS